MKKCYKLVCSEDESEEEYDSIWLDVGEKTVLLPPEISKYIEDSGILGILNKPKPLGAPDSG